MRLMASDHRIWLPSGDYHGSPYCGATLKDQAVIESKVRTLFAILAPATIPLDDSQPDEDPFAQPLVCGSESNVKREQEEPA